jgi:hypothetical protein
VTVTTHYAYTPAQVSQAFSEISTTLFAGKTAQKTPRMLITAGVPASGKTYLLKKACSLPAGTTTMCVCTNRSTAKNTRNMPR